MYQETYLGLAHLFAKAVDVKSKPKHLVAFNKAMLNSFEAIYEVLVDYDNMSVENASYSDENNFYEREVDELKEKLKKREARDYLIAEIAIEVAWNWLEDESDDLMPRAESRWKRADLVKQILKDKIIKKNTTDIDEIISAQVRLANN